MSNQSVVISVRTKSAPRGNVRTIHVHNFETCDNGPSRTFLPEKRRHLRNPQTQWAIVTNQNPNVTRPTQPNVNFIVHSAPPDCEGPSPPDLREEVERGGSPLTGPGAVVIPERVGRGTDEIEGMEVGPSPETKLFVSGMTQLHLTEASLFQ